MTALPRRTGEKCRWCGGQIVRLREWGASWLECDSCGHLRALEGALVPASSIPGKSTGEIPRPDEAGARNEGLGGAFGNRHKHTSTHGAAERTRREARR